MGPIDPNQPEGQHILLRCRNHPNLRWQTKNIDFIGARSLFFRGKFEDGEIVSLPFSEECPCEIADLEIVPVPALCDSCGEEQMVDGKCLCCGYTTLARQIDEDTCEAHGVFCCTDCFDMGSAIPSESPDPDWMNE